MATLLTLPLELRSQIYRDTLSPHLDQPLTDRQILKDDPIPSRWDSSFPSALLFANKQISEEATHIFYGKNTWVMIASMQRTYNTPPPTAAVPYVRTALLIVYLDAGGSFQGSTIRDSIAQSYRMLSRMKILQVLRIECAENRSLPAYSIEWAPFFPLHISRISFYLERCTGNTELRTHERMSQGLFEGSNSHV